MRPLKLTLSAFGPYASVQEIDFSKLGEAGIYLVTGETGAGKTTIFDGITYALYGEASGKDREAKMFRSKYATPDTKTYVELEFLHKGNVYRINRNPDYERPKLRGTGMAVEKADATLTLANGELVTRSKDVTAKIEELLGVNYNQFTKIVMIAQGAFKEFLFADTEERHVIFRKIFNTEHYFSLQMKLAQECKHIEETCETLRASVNQYLSDTVCAPNCELAEKLSEVHEGKLAVADSLEVIERILETDKETQKHIIEELHSYEMVIANLNEKIGRGKQIEQTKNLLEENKRCLKELDEKLRLADEQMHKAISMQPKLEELSQEIVILRKELESYSKVKEAKQLLDEELEKKIQLEKQISQLQNKREELERILVQNREKCKGLSEAEGYYREYLAEETRLEERGEVYTNIEAQINKIKDTNIALAKAQDLFIEAQTIYEQSRENYEEMKHVFFKEQAGFLAEGLKEGIPCPVCGSKHHPALAIVTDNAISKSQLDAYGEIVDDNMRTMQKRSQEAGVCLASRKEQWEVIAATIIRFPSITFKVSHVYEDSQLSYMEKEIEQAKKDVLRQQEILRGELLKQSQRIKQLEELSESIKKDEGALEKNRQESAEKIAELSNTSGVIMQMQRQLDDLLGCLPYKTCEEAEHILNEKNTQFREISEEIQQTKKAYDSVKEEHVAVITGIKNCEELLAHAKDIDVIALNELLRENEVSRQNLESEKSLTDTRIKTNEKLYKSIADKRSNLAELEEQRSMIKSLSDTANAKLVGKAKIDLETYVQMAYFERILKRANRRLLQMTNDQYELQRRQYTDNLRSKMGLDLDVIDHYNGSTRSVKSLSGGEVFKASLALALGLSDEIQCLTGGILIDSMFIDEGFGSLDEESLRQAISVLVRLSDGNRLVGIISHVDALKERIEKQIVITKNREGGSVARITAE